MPDFDPKQILYTPDALNDRAKEVAAQYPDAILQEVQQHNKLPDMVLKHYKAKSDLLVLGKLKTKTIRESGWSSDFIAPSLANGCYGGCAYCYVDRHKDINPITIFTNVDEIVTAVDQHVMKQPWPKIPNQTDPVFYTYDVGCNSDLSVDYGINKGIKEVLQFYKEHPRAKATFATKFVNRDLLEFDPQKKVRIRLSLMPAEVSKLVDVWTDSIEKRLLSINDFYDAGYDVHVNFSPVIVYNKIGNTARDWRDDYRELFWQLNEAVRDDVKMQMQYEVIFLTHNEAQHIVNLGINPKAEDLLWMPDFQETKRSLFGGINIRYKAQMKKRMVDAFINILTEEIPWCSIRYIF